MPEIFGDELAAIIKAEKPTIPITLITGFGDLMRAAEQRPLGADLVVSKPIRFGKFRETVALVIGATPV